jgi:hypothetical protein
MVICQTAVVAPSVRRRSPLVADPVACVRSRILAGQLIGPSKAGEAYARNPLLGVTAEPSRCMRARLHRKTELVRIAARSRPSA